MQPTVEDRIKEFEKIVLFYILRFVSDRNDDNGATNIIHAFTSLTPETRDPVYYQTVKDIFGGGLENDPYLLAKKVLEQIRHVPQQSSRE